MEAKVKEAKAKEAKAKEAKAKQFSDYPPVLTVEQTAELLQYDINTVYMLIRKKIIPIFPKGVKRGKRILKSQLLEVLENPTEIDIIKGA